MTDQTDEVTERPPWILKTAKSVIAIALIAGVGTGGWFLHEQINPDNLVPYSPYTDPDILKEWDTSAFGEPLLPTRDNMGQGEASRVTLLSAGTTEAKEAAETAERELNSLVEDGYPAQTAISVYGDRWAAWISIPDVRGWPSTCALYSDRIPEGVTFAPEVVAVENSNRYAPRADRGIWSVAWICDYSEYSSSFELSPPPEDDSAYGMEAMSAWYDVKEQLGNALGVAPDPVVAFEQAPQNIKDMVVPGLTKSDNKGAITYCLVGQVEPVRLSQSRETLFYSFPVTVDSVRKGFSIGDRCAGNRMDEYGDDLAMVRMETGRVGEWGSR